MYYKGSGKFVVAWGTCMRSDAFPLYNWLYVHMCRYYTVQGHTPLRETKRSHGAGHYAKDMQTGVNCAFMAVG